MTHKELLETMYPDIDVVEDRIYIKGGTQSISITDAFIAMVVHTVSFEYLLDGMREQEKMIAKLKEHDD